MVVFLTADTADTADTLISLCFSVLSLSAVSAMTVDKSFPVSPRACSRPSIWCLVPVNAGICSAVIAPARHRLPAARHRLTLAMRSDSTLAQQGIMGGRSQIKAEYLGCDAITAHGRVAHTG